MNLSDSQPDAHERTRLDEAVDAMAAGRVVIVVDDEDPENAGDFICAAEKVTADLVNFMVSVGRGQFAVPLLAERAKALGLEPVGGEPKGGRLEGGRLGAGGRRRFTVSVDLASSRSGISASDRAATVRRLADPGARGIDFIRPGSVQPLVARDGGVLRRAGHTEAAVDLARMAGLEPVGCVIQILDSQGELARRDRLDEIAREHSIPIITIQEIIRHRRRHEKLVERSVETVLPTARYGELRVFGYEVRFEDQEPIAIVKGDLASSDAPLVRVHSSCFTGDVLGSLRCECGDQLQMALERICAEGVGAVVYLPQEGRGIGLLAKLKAYTLQDQGLDTVEANLALGYRADTRDYGVGIQILKDLGLRRVRLLTNNPKKRDAFIFYGYDLEVVAQEPIIAVPNVHNERYLETKRAKLGHRLPDQLPSATTSGNAGSSTDAREQASADGVSANGSSTSAESR